MTLEINKPDATRFAKSLIFSPAGNGKTTFLGSAQADERTAPMLLLDFEGGEEVLSGLDIDVAKIRNWSDYDEAYELLTGDHEYKSVGIDSVSETHIWALLERVREKGPGRREPDLIEQGDYGVVTTQLRRLLRSFRDLPLHVFYTAHSKEIEERGVGKIQVPAMAGQMANELVGLMSVVGYLAVAEDEEGEQERVLCLQNYPEFRTKVRLPWDPEGKMEKPDEVESPTVTSLLDALQITQNGRKRSRKAATTTSKED